MTVTLGQALTANEDSPFDLDNPSVRQGYDKAREKMEKGSKAERAALDDGTLDDALNKKMLQALDIALDDILVQTWSGWAELRKYADPQQTPPEDINVVTVSNHTIESNLEPSVDVVVGDVKVHSFDFNVAVQLDMEGVELEVQGGAITGIRMGNLKLGGSVKLGDRTLFEKDLAQVTVPGAWRLAKPVPILWSGR